MPIYEYRCTSCSTRFESLVPSGESTTPSCPRCGAGETRRMLSVFAVGKTDRAAPRAGPCGSDDCACRRDID
jgi:putative FmdB family regulatory protein